MKPVIALAIVALLGAVGFALAPASELPVGPAEPPVALAPTPEAPAEEDEGAPRDVEGEGGQVEPETEEDEGEVVVDDGSLGEISLTGRVTPQSGTQPAVHVLAQIACPPETPVCEQEIIDTEADPDTGEFSLALYPGTWRLVARAEGFLPAHEEGLTLNLGDELGDLVMTLEPGERISGTVTEENEPRESVQVVAIGEGFTRLTVTDELGHYALEGLPRGSYVVRAYHSGYGGDEKTALSNSRVDLSLGHREKVHGRVVDGRGMPVEGVAIYSDWEQVTVLEADPYPASGEGLYGLGAHGCAPSPSCYQRAVTGVDGRFEIEAAPGESLVIGAQRGDQLALAEGVLPGQREDVTLELKAPTTVALEDVDEEQADAPRVPFFRRVTRHPRHGWVKVKEPNDATYDFGEETPVEGDVITRYDSIIY